MSAVLELLLRLQGADEAGDAVDGLGEKVEGTGDSAENAGSKFSGFGTVATTAVAGVTVAAVAAGAAVVAIGAAAFDISSQVQASQNDLQASLGLTQQQAEELGEVATNVWKNNFGEDIAGATDALIEVRQQMKSLSDEELQQATENAFRLADTFELEIGESAQTANTLMKEFGLTSDQAFDFISAGFQEGLNSSDDFVDSINEYSNLFHEMGFTADEFFAIMDTGLESGVLGTDKIADAFKEFNIRASEGTDDLRDAFGTLGLDYGEIIDQVAAGETTWADQFDSILTGLQGIEDPIERNRLQVALFGTMAEDLGADFTESLSLATLAVDEMAGSTAILDAQYNTLPSVIEGFKRQALAALIPIGDVLLMLANEIMPFVQQGFEWFEANVAPAIQMAADTAVAFFEQFQQGNTIINEGIEILRQLWEVAIVPLIERINELVERFGGWENILKVVGAVLLATVIPTILQVVGTIALVIGIVVLVVEAIHWLLDMWQADFLGIRTSTETAIQGVIDFITNALQWLQQFWAENGDQILATAEQTWQSVVTTIETVFAFIQEIFAAFSLAFEGDWRGFGEALREIWDKVWEKLSELAVEGWETIKEIFVTAWEDIKEFFTSGRASELGRAIADGIASGISAGASAIAEAARAAAQAALDAAKGFLGIDSPSKAFIEVGQNINEGMTLGLKDNKMVIDAIEATVNSLVGTTEQNQNVNLFNPNFFGIQDTDNFFNQVAELS